MTESPHELSLPLAAAPAGKALPLPAFETLEALLARLEPDTVLRLAPAATDAFSCSVCGVCCEHPWRVNLSRDYYEQWYPVLDAHPLGRFKAPFRRLPGEEARAWADLRRDPETQACIFLQADRSCFLHANYGEQALSEACKGYPRSEQWLGAYLLRGLYTSCPDVQELLQTRPQLHYELIRPGPEALLRYAQRSHPLGREAGLLWLGLQLDLLADSSRSPVQSLRALTAALRPFAAGPLAALDTGTLKAMYQALQADPHEASASHAPEQLALAETWLLGLLRPLEQLKDTGAVGAFVRESLAGTLPALEASERALLNRFLRAWLSYRCLSLRCLDAQDRPFFYPAYFLLAAHVALLQWLALYARQQSGGPLHFAQLQQAATLIGVRFEQAPEIFDRFAMLSPSRCLDGMAALLSVDFGREA